VDCGAASHRWPNVPYSPAYKARAHILTVTATSGSQRQSVNAYSEVPNRPVNVLASEREPALGAAIHAAVAARRVSRLPYRLGGDGAAVARRLLRRFC
jgi:ribulose kinase